MIAESHARRHPYEPELRVLVLGIDAQIVRLIQVSRKPREKLSKTGFMMYSKNVRSPVLM
jgi:hypothetical protein